jgi:hypothetical protein
MLNPLTTTPDIETVCLMTNRHRNTVVALLCALLALLFVVACITTYITARESVAAHAVQQTQHDDSRIHTLSVFPLCEYEDSVDCQWNADVEGNGAGDSYVSIGEGPVQRVFYSDGHVESFPNGYYCDPDNDQAGDGPADCTRPN